MSEKGTPIGEVEQRLYGLIDTKGQRRFKVVYDPFEPRETIFDRMIRGDPDTRRGIIASRMLSLSRRSPWWN